MAEAPRMASYEDLFDLPDNVVGDGGDAMTRAEPFDAVELDLSEWWSGSDTEG